MYKKLKSGFSLAEALITLLIVCLITLASIPILTKKRRNLDEGQRGMWICSRNSAGQYVYWDKNNPVGQKDNPDSWVTTNKCVFTPPAGADRFSLTVIGGGGGGGNGESVHEVLAKVEGGHSTPFSPTKTDMYNVKVIGGGGGGGGGEDDKCNAGAGGGGGGMFDGFIPLFKGTSYTLTAGRGGDWHDGEDHGGCSTSHSRTPGQDGTISTFKYASGTTDTFTDIAVGGGQGGDSVACNPYDCRGGDWSAAGRGVIRSNYHPSLQINGKMVSSIGESVTGQNGEAGNYYDWSRDTPPQGGKNKYTDSSGLNVTTYGDGGDAGKECNPWTAGKNGVGGLVVVSKNWKHFGEGGKAAVPASYYLPSITGQVEVEIAESAQAELAGGNTIARIVRNGIVGRTFIGYGAEGGDSNEYLTEPATGEHSQFTMKGGGTPAPDCTNRTLTPAGWGPVIKTVKKCKKISCNISVANEYSVEKNDKIMDNNYNSAGVQIVPAGFVKSAYWGNKYVPKQIKDGTENLTTPPDNLEPFQWNLRTSMSKSKEYFESVLKIYNYIFNVYGPLGHLLGGGGLNDEMKSRLPEFNIGDDAKTEFSSYYNSDEIYSTYRCYRDENIKYQKVCSEEFFDTETTTGYHDAVWEDARCESPGGNGTSFGAGGGGGNAADQAGVFSLGGKGAPGAVIIEW